MRSVRCSRMVSVGTMLLAFVVAAGPAVAQDTTYLFDFSATTVSPRVVISYRATAPTLPGSTSLNISTQDPSLQFAQSGSRTADGNWTFLNSQDPARGFVGAVLSYTLLASTGTSFRNTPGTYVISSSVTTACSTQAGSACVGGISTGIIKVGTAPGTVSVTVSSAPPANTPTIQPGGIVPLNSRATTIQPGEWVSIYGASLASDTAIWNGTFPTTLGGTSVRINGKSAYLWYVSPAQINLQVPDDTATGTVPVVVTTSIGSASSTVTLGPFAPSFNLLDSKHVTGIILRSNGTGAYGGGTYDILGPTGNSLGYATVAAQAGDILEIFGVGFGPTSPAIPAGQVFSGAASTLNPVKLLINNLSVTPLFAGLSSAGLYQINLMVPPGAGTGDVSLFATVGGMQTPSGILISLF